MTIVKYKPPQSFEMSSTMLDSALESYPVSFFCFEWESHKKIVDKSGARPTYSRTRYAAVLLHKVLQTSYFREVNTHSKANLILGLPSDSPGSSIRPFQRVSHYDYTFSLGSKAGYHKLMKKFSQRATPSQMSFYPESYLLPKEKAQLAEAFTQSPGSLWISKPGGGSRGEGIVVIDRPPSKVNGPRIIQRYIPRPLLIRGLKFDLRFYVAVTSLDPLQIYVHEKGLTRLATEPYAENLGNLSNRSAHLTNFSINKNNPAFVSTDDLADDGTGNKWTHGPFWEFLSAETPFDPNQIRWEIEDAFVTIIVSARETFMAQSNHRTSFEVFGFDVILDDEGRVSILEVNVTPAMGTASTLEDRKSVV
jgi:hypothetical protein